MYTILTTTTTTTTTFASNITIIIICMHITVSVCIYVPMALDRRWMEKSMTLQQCFESIIFTTLYPKSQIDIFVQVLNDDGGMYECMCVYVCNVCMYI